jgi:hypothetical protein
MMTMVNTGIYVDESLLQKADDLCAILGWNRSKLFGRLIELAALQEIEMMSALLKDGRELFVDDCRVNAVYLEGSGRAAVI